MGIILSIADLVKKNKSGKIPLGISSSYQPVSYIHDYYLKIPAGTMEDNVVWNCNGLMLKGDYQTARGNLVFNKFNGPNPLKSGYCALCVWRHILKSPQVLYLKKIKSAVHNLMVQ